MTDVDVRTLVRQFWAVPFHEDWDELAEEIVRRLTVREAGQ